MVVHRNPRFEHAEMGGVNLDMDMDMDDRRVEDGGKLFVAVHANNPSIRHLNLVGCACVGMRTTQGNGLSGRGCVGQHFSGGKGGKGASPLVSPSVM